MQLEDRFVKIALKEENHLANVYNSSLYRGWYIYQLETDEGEEKFKDTIVRFRMPPTIPLYKDVLRNFSEDERILGMHRLLTGKDLREETSVLLKFDNLNDYVKTLKDDEIKDLLGHMPHMVTLDCNRVPYMHIRRKYDEDIHDVDQIKFFINKHPDYLRMLYDVLNENISIPEVDLLSNHVIYNELAEINATKR